VFVYPCVFVQKRNTLNRHRGDPKPLRLGSLFAIVAILAKLARENKD